MTQSNKPPKPLMSEDYQRSFGRILNRKLTSLQKHLIEEVLPQFVVDIEKKDLPASLFEDKSKQIWLEIGFGGGEHLAAQAKNNPDTGIIGCEPFINGVTSLLKYIEADNLDHVRVLYGDARLLIEKLEDNSLDRVFILFPDPWPKARHHKKRIVSKETLDMLQRVIKPGGILDVATDHVDYVQWIDEHLSAHSGFKEEKRDRTVPPEGWVQTRYQQKAKEQGRDAVFFRGIAR